MPGNEWDDPRSDPWVRPPENLRIVIPFIPPTSNHIYMVNKKFGSLVKTKQARAFENKFSKEVVAKYLPWISQMADAERDPSIIYEINLIFYFAKWDLMNKGWFQTPRKAKTRYKKMDTGNRLKLIVDCVARALGVDDAHYFDTGGEKRNCEAYGIEPQVHIYLLRRDPAFYGVG